MCVWLSCIHSWLAEHGAEHDLMLRALLAFPLHGIVPGDVHWSLNQFLLFFSFFCQGERGLDGLPGKHGEIGEQVGGYWPQRASFCQDRSAWAQAQSSEGLGALASVLLSWRLGDSPRLAAAHGLCQHKGAGPENTALPICPHLRGTCEH